MGASSLLKRQQLSVSLLTIKQHVTSHLSVLVLLQQPVRSGLNSDNGVTDHSSITDELLIDTGRYGLFVSMNESTSTRHSSSNTWIGAGRTYVRTSTSVQTNNTVVCTALILAEQSNPSFFKGSDLWWGIFHRYVSLLAQFERLANFLGNDFMDTVTLSTLAILGQSIGVATEVNSSGVIMTSNVLIFITITSRCF